MKSAILTALLLSLPCVFACDDVDRAVDCGKICNKYQECIDGDYDVDKCEDRCRDMTESDDTAQIDECEACVDERSCSGATFNCLTECAGIVAQ